MMQEELTVAGSLSLRRRAARCTQKKTSNTKSQVFSRSDPGQILEIEYNHGTVPSLINHLKTTLNISNYGASSYANLRSPTNDFSRLSTSPSNS